MDRFALSVANPLVGNPEDNAAVLEATFLGPELEFTSDATVAIAGSELPPRVDGETRVTWTSFHIKKGQTLAFDFLKGGARAYIAVSGGIDVPVALGPDRRTPSARSGAFRAENSAAGDSTRARRAPRRDRGPHSGAEASALSSVPAELRMTPGLYWHRITEAAGRHFFEDAWKVAPEADRIGYRFRGADRPLEFVPREPPFGAGSDPSNIVDACYPYGSIQVPGGHGTHSAASRRGLRRRLFHDRNSHLGRSRSDWTAATSCWRAF